MAPRDKTTSSGSLYKSTDELLSPDKHFKITSGFKKYPSYRDNVFKNPFTWLAGKRKDDDIGNLWRIHDKLYDFSNFIDNHPGGKFWLEETRGTDITENFMTTHFTSRAESHLKEFYIKDADQPRVSPYTFRKEDFYMTLKEKVKPILRRSGTGSTANMRLIQDGLMSMFLLFFFLGANFHSAIFMIISGVFLALSTNAAHNFFHQKDNWRMYIFDLSLISSREWRISHAISHHNFPNTIYDYEIAMTEPYLYLLPHKDKSFFHRYVMQIAVYLLFAVAFFIDLFSRFIHLLQGKVPVHWSNFIPLLELLIIFQLTDSFTIGLWLWFILHASSNLVIALIGITAAHHHPNIFREGDVVLKEKDFGLAQMAATRDRGVIMSNLFLTSFSFGNHTLHHLFPTVDHSKLPMLMPALQETCKEFGIEFNLMTIWDLFIGFHQTMAKVVANVRSPDIIKESRH